MSYKSDQLRTNENSQSLSLLTKMNIPRHTNILATAALLLVSSRGRPPAARLCSDPHASRARRSRHAGRFDGHRRPYTDSGVLQASDGNFYGTTNSTASPTMARYFGSRPPAQ